MNALQQWQTLSAQQQKVVTIYFRHQFTKLSNRAAHALSKFVKSDHEPALFFSAIPTANFDYSKLPNIGLSSSNELSDFYNKVVAYLPIVADMPSNSSALIAQENRQLLKSIFDADEDVLDILAAKATEIGYFPIFLAIEKLLETPPVKKKYRVSFFNECLGYQQDEIVRKAHDLSEQLGLSKERCRQLANAFVTDFPEDFAFIKKLSLGSKLIDQLNLDADLIEIKDELRTLINFYEGTNFTNKFITKVYALLLEGNYELLGYEHNSPGSWKSLYLIKKGLNQQFDFYSFLDMLKDRKAARVELPYVLSIREQLNTFKTSATINDEAILKTLEILIEREAALQFNPSAEITIPQNTPMQLWQYIEEALIVLGEARTGHSLLDIVAVLQQRYPSELFRETSLMSTISNNPKFIYFGRSSYYGLKVWEETGYIKGGTIRDIVYQFLEGMPEPQHIQNISQYVQKFRDTDDKSIYSNLQQEENSKFLLLSGQFIGLPTKDYSNWQKPNKIVGSLFTRRLLKRFDGLQFEEVKEDFISRGYFNLQIAAIFNKKIEDKEIFIDEKGLFWVNEIQIFAGESEDTTEEEMVLLKFAITDQDDKEQNELLYHYGQLSKDEIIIQLDQINQDTDEKGVIKSSGYKRNNAAIVLIKILRDFKCQICGHTILKKDGSRYVEAAHITPKHQKGKETKDNILLLCPNHHKEFDLGDLNVIIRTSTTIEFVLNSQPHIILLDHRVVL